MSKPTNNENSPKPYWRGADETPSELPATGYGGFAPRPPGLFAIKRGIVDVATLPEPLQHVFNEFDENLATPFVGLTSDGTVISNLYPLRNTGLSTEPIADAARRYLALLEPGEVKKGVLPVDSTEWRAWINAFAPTEPHGLLLDEASPAVRAAAMAIFEAALSPHGYEQLRATMTINEALGDIAPGYEDTLREYMYWFTIFGEPSGENPWGFQLYGHHACVNVFVLGGQLTIGPMFLGAEPRIVENGRYSGTRVFDDELSLAVEVMASLSPEQRKQAVLSDSVKWADLPAELAHPTEGRMRGSVARDNAVVPSEGIRVGSLEAAQRDRVRALISLYVLRLPEEHARLKMREVDNYLDQTSFAWAGVPDVEEPFYYKIHSPVIFIELDAHAGIFLSNDDPKPFHIHTIVRIPNGNDYGQAWLRAFEAAAPTR